MSKKKETKTDQVVQASSVEESYQIILQNREKLVAAWIAETGLKPSETLLIMRKYPDNSIGWFCRRITDEDRENN